MTTNVSLRRTWCWNCLLPPKDENERIFRSAFEALLENPELLPDGSTLGFGLRHVYQAEDTLGHVYSLLKGSDVAV
jgi:hypothetical protein